MILFLVNYLDDADYYTYLTVGESEASVKEREEKRLEEECSCFMYCTVFEVNEVDGYRISVNKM